MAQNTNAILAALSHYRSPAQIAWGVAIGTALGLVPKDNLVSLGLIVAMMFLRINHLSACLVAIPVSCLGIWVDCLTDPLGMALLSLAFIRGPISLLVSMPVLAWTRLNNTVVLGGLTLGMTTTVPVYLSARWMVLRAQAKLAELTMHRIATQAQSYRKSATDTTRQRSEKAAIAMSVPLEGDLAMQVKTPIQPSFAMPSVEFQKTDTRFDCVSFDTHIDCSDASHANAELETELVAIQMRSSIQITQLPTSEAFVQDTSLVDETILRETIIEVVRYKQSRIEAVLGSPEEPELDEERSFTLYVDQQGSSMNVAQPTNGLAQNETMPIAAINIHMPHDQALGNGAQDRIPSPKIVKANPVSGEESLRYLLWHINESNTSRRTSEKSV